MNKEVNELCNKLETILYSSSSNKALISETLRRAVEILQEANEEYYGMNNSIISDFLYDKLRKLTELAESTYPEFATGFCEVVGSRPTLGTKVKHTVPMLSLNNAYDIGDIIDWLERVDVNNEYSILLQSKLDGCSIGLLYENGKLVRGVTRGDGVTGEDVTQSVMQIRNIPKKIAYDKTLEIRGEVLMSYSSFSANNERLVKRGEKAFANPRNAASGTLRQLDPNVVRERDLYAKVYSIVNPETHGLSTEIDVLNFLLHLGFDTPSMTVLLAEELRMRDVTDLYFVNRSSMDDSKKYPTDGLVLKLNNIGDQNRLGNTAKSPRWAIAFKYSPEEVVTTLNEVIWQVGRTGKITPVAVFNPVILDGTVVSRATLHNVQQLTKGGYKINDSIVVTKAAEIIPQVIRYDKYVRESNEKKGSAFKIKIPHKCPCCGENTKVVGKELMCNNDDCKDKVIGRFLYFLSRDGINANGIGPAIITEAVNKGLIKDLQDIFKLAKKPHILSQWEGFGDKMVENTISAIKESTKAPFDKLVGALGIPLVGHTVAKQLVRTFPSYKELINAVDNHPEVIKDAMGEATGNNIVEFFKKEKNRVMMNELKDEGFILEKNVSRSPLSGMKVCITGSSNIDLSRSDMQKYLEDEYGIKVSNSVGPTTSYVVALEKATQHKLDTANKYDIPILNWNTLLIRLKKEENDRR